MLSSVFITIHSIWVSKMQGCILSFRFNWFCCESDLADIYRKNKESHFVPQDKPSSHLISPNKENAEWVQSLRVFPPAALFEWRREKKSTLIAWKKNWFGYRTEEGYQITSLVENIAFGEFTCNKKELRNWQEQGLSVEPYEAWGKRYALRKGRGSFNEWKLGLVS